VYASVEDLRAEGVTPATASDERLLAVLVEASAFVDHATGWFFEPRARTFRLDGRGTPSLEPPIPPIQLSDLRVDGTGLPLGADDLVVVGAPVDAGFYAPRLWLRRGVFPRGSANVEATGLWGYTEPDGTPDGRTPLAIRRATMLLVLRWLPGLGAGDASSGARQGWRIIEERTRDQSYRLATPGALGVVFTGDPEIDLVLARYRRPMGLGAA
jgi:hypothetical protein